MIGQRTVDNDVKVEVRRSARRSRTVSASRRGDAIVVSIPQRFTASQERQWVDRMVQRVLKQEAGRRLSSADLAARAKLLSNTYLSGLAQPRSIRWVTNQNSRWGSCTPRDASIRISSRLLDVPGWVLDYVLLHELTHLLEANHGPRFWQLVGIYPQAERARGYLEGLSAAGYLDHLSTLGWLSDGDEVID